MTEKDEIETLPKDEEVKEKPEEKEEIKPKIVLLDSNNKSRGKAAKVLKKGGYNVVETTTTKECIKALEGKDVDLLLMDTELEEEDGWDVLKMIHDDWELRESKIPIAVFTERPISKELAKRRDLERLVDYIIRPKSKKELKEKIDGLFDAFTKLDETGAKVKEKVNYSVAEEYKRISKALRIRLRLATALKTMIDQESEENPSGVKELRELLSNELRMLRSYKKRKVEIKRMLKA